jgi:hypothetical protein
MKATKIELVSKAEKEDPQPEPEPEEEVKPEPEPEEEVTPAPEPEEEATPEPAPEEEAAPEPEKKEEPAPEPKKEEPAEIIIKANATILEGNEEKKTAKLKLDNGEEITLNIDKKTTIASGYFPAKDDVVKITYEKNKMVLREIQLVSRPATEAPAEGE